MSSGYRDTILMEVSWSKQQMGSQSCQCINEKVKARVKKGEKRYNKRERMCG